MAKPIFLVRLPEDTTQDRLSKIARELMQRIPDWHVLVVIARSAVEEPTFEAFSEKTATDIEIEELKKIALAHIA